jgi:hypothetical protein
MISFKPLGVCEGTFSLLPSLSSTAEVKKVWNFVSMSPTFLHCMVLNYNIFQSLAMNSVVHRITAGDRYWVAFHMIAA